MNFRMNEGRIPTSAALVRHAGTKLGAMLRAFADRLGDVQVSIAEEGGRRGSAEKRCLILAHVHGAGQVVVEDRQADFYAAIDRAADKLRRAIEHRVGKEWPRRRARGTQRSPAHGNGR